MLPGELGHSWLEKNDDDPLFLSPENKLTKNGCNTWDIMGL